MRNTNIFISKFQLAEIYHALAFRGNTLSLFEAKKVMLTIKHSSSFVISSVSLDSFESSLNLSSSSGIHIWDYLCIVPIQHNIYRFYTNDVHFKHKSFQGMSVEITNPLSFWETL